MGMGGMETPTRERDMEGGERERETLRSAEEIKPPRETLRSRKTERDTERLTYTERNIIRQRFQTRRNKTKGGKQTETENGRGWGIRPHKIMRNRDEREGERGTERWRDGGIHSRETERRGSAEGA